MLFNSNIFKKHFSSKVFFHPQKVFFHPQKVFFHPQKVFFASLQLPYSRAFLPPENTYNIYNIKKQAKKNGDFCG